jgi:hypothetical protein
MMLEAEKATVKENGSTYIIITLDLKKSSFLITEDIHS